MWFIRELLRSEASLTMALSLLLLAIFFLRRGFFDYPLGISNLVIGAISIIVVVFLVVGHFRVQPTCPACGEIVKSDYCTYCGQIVEENIESTCPGCGAEWDSAFCGDCGNSMIRES